jgi:hypothetical protein
MQPRTKVSYHQSSNTYSKGAIKSAARVTLHVLNNPPHALAHQSYNCAYNHQDLVPRTGTWVPGPGMQIAFQRLPTYKNASIPAGLLG